MHPTGSQLAADDPELAAALESKGWSDGESATSTATTCAIVAVVASTTLHPRGKDFQVVRSDGGNADAEEGAQSVDRVEDVALQLVSVVFEVTSAGTGINQSIGKYQQTLQ